MVGFFGGIVPANGHLPLVPGLIVGADQKVYNLDCGFGVALLKKAAYTSHNFTDLGVSLSQSFMAFGGCHLENRDYAGGRVSAGGWHEIDDKRVKEGVIGC